LSFNPAKGQKAVEARAIENLVTESAIPRFAFAGDFGQERFVGGDSARAKSASQPIAEVTQDRPLAHVEGNSMSADV